MIICFSFSRPEFENFIIVFHDGASDVQILKFGVIERGIICRQS